MLTLQHIHKAFNDDLVLNDVSFSLDAGEVIALVGDNGAGKSTLLKIMQGSLKPDLGAVIAANESIGYVPQDAFLGATVADVFKNTPDKWRVDCALSMVGLNVSAAAQVSGLSGGQKTRLALAKVLACNPAPTVLLLDEPTNNLDADGLAWLKQFIRTFTGAIVVVSHDRAFINAVATKVAELHKGKLTWYGGDYNFYEQQKAVEQQAKNARYQESVQERKRITKVAQNIQQRAKNGLRHNAPKDNDKAQFKWHQNNVQRSFSGQLKAVESRLDQLKDAERPEAVKNFAIAFDGESAASKLILRLENVGKRYSFDVLHAINLELRGSQRIHVVGKNGSGKTTLLKIAAGLLKPDSGTRTLGASVSIGYFSQQIDGLDHNATAIDSLKSAGMQSTSAYRAAIHLGLTTKDVAKCVGELSRGQQAKIGIAMLLLGAHDLLILDEPTNHLDIATRRRIETALQTYNGAILFASHDDYFVKALRPTDVFEC